MFVAGPHPRPLPALRQAQDKARREGSFFFMGWAGMGEIRLVGVCRRTPPPAPPRPSTSSGQAQDTARGEGNFFSWDGRRLGMDVFPARPHPRSLPLQGEGGFHSLYHCKCDAFPLPAGGEGCPKGGVGSRGINQPCPLATPECPKTPKSHLGKSPNRLCTRPGRAAGECPKIDEVESLPERNKRPRFLLPAPARQRFSVFILRDFFVLPIDKTFQLSTYWSLSDNPEAPHSKIMPFAKCDETHSEKGAEKNPVPHSARGKPWNCFH